MVKCLKDRQRLDTSVVPCCPVLVLVLHVARPVDLLVDSNPNRPYPSCFALSRSTTMPLNNMDSLQGIN